MDKSGKDFLRCLANKFANRIKVYTFTPPICYNISNEFGIVPAHLSPPC